MTESEGLATAKDYVDTIIEINRQYGAEPVVPQELYNEIVQEIEKSSERLIELQGRVAVREKALVE